jgi:hypothetical protein
MSKVEELLRQRAVSEVEQLYTVQGIPIPGRLLNIFGLTLLCLALMWFLLHLWLIRNAEAKEEPMFVLLTQRLPKTVFCVAFLIIPIAAAALIESSSWWWL